MPTKAELQKELKKRGVKFESDANKGRLEVLLAEANAAAEIEAAPAEEAAEAAEEPAGEGPTELEPPEGPPPAPEPEVERPKKGELEVVDGLLHNGKPVPVGSKAPEDLSDDQVERLCRLGVLAKAE